MFDPYKLPRPSSAGCCFIVIYIDADSADIRPIGGSSLNGGISSSSVDNRIRFGAADSYYRSLATSRFVSPMRLLVCLLLSSIDRSRRPSFVSIVDISASPYA